MKIQLASLILAFSLTNYAPLVRVGALRTLQADCPTIMVEGPKDIETSDLVFSVKISGGNVTSDSLTYRWTVYGGDMKEGQGTSSVTITNFDLRKKSVTVVVDVKGLPAKCGARASCSIVV